jgi:hypothetical protein
MKKSVIVILTIAILLLTTSITIKPASATEEWSEDFQSGLLTDWTTFAMEDPQNGPVIEGNFTIEDGALKSLDNDINFAEHNSTVNVGTWSFDMYVPDVGSYVGFAFMSNGSRPLVEGTCRLIAIEANIIAGTFVFWQVRYDGVMGLDTPYQNSGGVAGWHHIDITRTNTGLIRIYLNGSTTPIFDMVTNDVTSSLVIACYTHNAAGGAFDNIVVDNEILITPPASPTPTPTTTPLPWDLIAITGGVVVVVLVLIVVVIKRR